MAGSWNVLLSIVPVFIILTIGAGLRHFHVLTPEADRSLLRVIINILVPCLILDSTLFIESLRNFQTLLTAPVLGLGTAVGGYFIALLFAQFAELRNQKSKATFAYVTALYNYGYIPIPLIAALFDVETLGVLFLFNLGVEVALWLLLAQINAGKDPLWKQILTPPIFAIVIGVSLNVSGGSQWIPPLVLTTIKILSPGAVPLALLLIGATMADLMLKDRPRWNLKAVGIGVLLRNALIPLAMLALLFLLSLPIELQRVLIVQAAMPAAIMPIVLVHHRDGDVPIALSIVLATTFVSLLTIPFWISFGLYLIASQ